MEVFEIAGAAPRERVQMWNSVTSSTFGPIAITPVDEDDFDARMVRRSSGPVGLASVSSAAAIVRGANARDTRPGRFILLNEQGVAVVHQDEHEVVLNAGQLTVIRSTVPYEISFFSHNHMVVTHVPDQVRSVDWGLATGMARDEQQDGLIHALIRQWARASVTAGADPGIYARLVHDSLAACWGEGLSNKRYISDSRARWRDDIFAYIDAHLTDPDLSARTAGEALGASPRHIQMVVASAGTTFSRAVRERRLEHAADLLLSDPDASIARVAFTVGFGDVSHFIRSFHEKFACTATQWRQAQPAPQDR